MNPSAPRVGRRSMLSSVARAALIAVVTIASAALWLSLADDARAASKLCTRDLGVTAFCLEVSCPSVESWTPHHTGGSTFFAMLQDSQGHRGSWIWSGPLTTRTVRVHAYPGAPPNGMEGWVGKDGPASGVSAYTVALSGFSNLCNV